MINQLAQTAFETAIIRGKTSKDLSHDDTFFGIFNELKEFREASEIDPSEHLPQYTQAQEELTDVLICCLTELHSITGALYYLTGFIKPFKGSSTKSGNNPKAIKARRKKNKNKKTHRR